MVAGEDRDHRAQAEDRGAGLDDPDPPEAVRGDADDRSQAVHADDVEGDDERRQVGLAVVAHVERGHRHDRDHRRLRDHDRDQAETGAREAADHRERAPDLRRPPHPRLARRGEAAGHHERVRPHEDGDDQCGEEEVGAREHERSDRAG